MDEILFNDLTLQAKEKFVKEHGSFVEAQDYYSYRILLYSLDQHHVELLYDFSDDIVSVEFVEKKNPPDHLSKDLQSFLEDAPM
jgi:hypothetical protein